MEVCGSSHGLSLGLDLRRYAPSQCLKRGSNITLAAAAMNSDEYRL